MNLSHPRAASPPPDRRPGRVRYGLIVPLLSALLLLPDLGRAPVRREKELRVVLTARDMDQTGRWIEPHYKGEPRLRKPPLMYWLVGGLYRLGAPVTSAGWSRLPSAVAGIAFTSLLYGLGRWLVGRRRAFTAAAVAMVSLVVLEQGRLAETDMGLALFTAGAALAGALALRGRDSRWWVAALGCAGIGFLFKGPAAVSLPPLAWLALAWWQRGRVQAPFRSPHFWLGLALCVGLIVPWYVAVAHLARAATGGQVEAELSALLATSRHQASIFYYTYATVLALAPWGVLLPVALVYGVRAGRGRAGWGFPLVWFVTSVVTLSCLSSKQFHYTTLLVAPAALLISLTLHGRLGWVRRWSARVARALALLLLACALVVAVAWVLRGDLGGRALAVLSAAAAVVLAVGLRQREPSITLAPYLAAALAVLLPAGVRLIPPRWVRGDAVRSVMQRAEALAPGAGPVVLAGRLHTEASFYAERPVMLIDSIEQAWEAAAPGTLLILTAHAHDHAQLARASAQPLCTASDQWTSATAYWVRNAGPSAAAGR